jgi:hypothetical protein
MTWRYLTSCILYRTTSTCAVFNSTYVNMLTFIIRHLARLVANNWAYVWWMTMTRRWLGRDVKLTAHLHLPPTLRMYVLGRGLLGCKDLAAFILRVKLEATRSCETLVSYHITIRRHTTEDHDFKYPTTTLHGVTSQKTMTSSILPQHYAASQHRRPRLESSSPWKTQIS